MVNFEALISLASKIESILNKDWRVTIIVSGLLVENLIDFDEDLSTNIYSLIPDASRLTLIINSKLRDKELLSLIYKILQNVSILNITTSVRLLVSRIDLNVLSNIAKDTKLDIIATNGRFIPHAGVAVVTGFHKEASELFWRWHELKSTGAIIPLGALHPSSLWEMRLIENNVVFGIPRWNIVRNAAGFILLKANTDNLLFTQFASRILPSIKHLSIIVGASYVDDEIFNALYISISCIVSKKITRYFRIIWPGLYANYVHELKKIALQFNISITIPTGNNIMIDSKDNTLIAKDLLHNSLWITITSSGHIINNSSIEPRPWWNDYLLNVYKDIKLSGMKEHIINISSGFVIYDKMDKEIEKFIELSQRIVPYKDCICFFIANDFLKDSISYHVLEGLLRYIPAFLIKEIAIIPNYEITNGFIEHISYLIKQVNAIYTYKICSNVHDLYSTCKDISVINNKYAKWIKIISDNLSTNEEYTSNFYNKSNMVSNVSVDTDHVLSSTNDESKSIVIDSEENTDTEISYNHGIDPVIEDKTSTHVLSNNSMDSLNKIAKNEDSSIAIDAKNIINDAQEKEKEENELKEKKEENYNENSNKENNQVNQLNTIVLSPLLSSNNIDVAVEDTQSFYKYINKKEQDLHLLTVMNIIPKSPVLRMAYMNSLKNTNKNIINIILATIRAYIYGDVSINLRFYNNDIKESELSFIKMIESGIRVLSIFRGMVFYHVAYQQDIWDTYTENMIIYDPTFILVSKKILYKKNTICYCIWSVRSRSLAILKDDNTNIFDCIFGFGSSLIVLSKEYDKENDIYYIYLCELFDNRLNEINNKQDYYVKINETLQNYVKGLKFDNEYNNMLSKYYLGLRYDDNKILKLELRNKF